MLFIVALFSSLLLVPVVLAVPPVPRSGPASMAPCLPGVNRRENAACGAGDTTNSTNSAGAMLFEGNKTFNTVTGTFTTPTFSGKDGSGASFSVMLDGWTCPHNYFEAWVLAIVENGEPTYRAIYEFAPGNAYNFVDITISAGDVIKLTLVASDPSDPNSGTATVENLSTGQGVSENVKYTTPLCGRDAGWFVVESTQNGSVVPLADFGTVTFTKAEATGPAGMIYNPSYATTIEMVQNNTVLTQVWTNETFVTIQYEPSL